MSGLAEHVVYNVEPRVTLKAKMEALVPISSNCLPGMRALVYDPKRNEINCSKAIHLHNDTDMVLANGHISILESGRLVSQVEFAPMLPKDDQLIHYGEDGTFSINKTMRKEDQSATVLNVCPLYTSTTRKKKTRGCVTTFKRVKATTYIVKNNSTEKGNLSKRLYIDHTASSAQRGYTIITTDKSTKTATGFARYEFFLSAQEELEWTVLEEAVHDIEMTCHRTVKSILESVLQPSKLFLVDDGALTEDAKTELLNYLRDEKKKALLNRINNNCLTSQELMQLQNRHEKHKEEGTEDKMAEVIDDKVDLEDALGMELIRSMVERHAAQFKKEDMERVVATHHAHIKEVYDNQSRLRENIKSMEKVASSKLVDRYLVDLDKEEDDLIDTRQVITALEVQMAALERDVERLGTIVEVEVNRLLKM
jgi:hypothetical protein